MQELKGLGVALITPFTKEGRVDYAALERLVKHLQKGADYLVVAGTTGEAATLTDEEQFTVLDFIIEVNNGKLPVVFGIGGNNTAAVAAKIKSFDREGVMAFLSASPFYNKPTQEGIYRHYMALANASRLPLILYNVPGRTASNVLPATVKRLAEDHHGIIGIKEAAGSIEQVMELSRILPDGFLLISGDDALLLPHMACGGHGVISVAANAYPKRLHDIVQLSSDGHFAKARAIHYTLLPFLTDLFKDGNPGGIKEVLKHMGICENHMRLPLYPVSELLSRTLYSHVATIGLE